MGTGLTRNVLSIWADVKSAFDLRVERTAKRLVNRDFAPSGNSDRPYKEVPTMDAEDARTATPPAREGIFRHSATHILAAIVCSSCRGRSSHSLEADELLAALDRGRPLGRESPALMDPADYRPIAPEGSAPSIENGRALLIPRRTLLGMMAGGLLAVPLTALGQESREAKIGLLTERTLPPPFIDALRHGLTEAGWVEGRSFRIEQRSAEGDLERLPALAAELIGSGVTVIVTGVGSPAALAAKRATTTIPIVFVTGGDPVDFGIVTNRLKPGANVTGLGGGILAIQERLEMLRDMAPRTKHVAFLRNLTNPIHPQIWRAVEREGARLDLALQEISVHGPSEIGDAFTAMQRKRLDAVFVPGDAMFSRERAVLVELAARFRLPAVYGDRLFPDAGGLMSFSVDLVDLCRRAAAHVDRILRGARAGDLAVEEAVKFDVVINVAAANALGLKIPASLRERAELIP